MNTTKEAAPPRKGCNVCKPTDLAQTIYDLPSGTFGGTLPVDIEMALL